MADGLNDQRVYRVTVLSAEFETVLRYVMDIDENPPHQDDYYTDGYSTLRRCNLEATRVSELRADTSPASSSGGEDERRRRELAKNRLDAYSRRHGARKILLWQRAALRWVQDRDAILQGQRPEQHHASQLAALDGQLRAQLTAINDRYVYDELRTRDYNSGCWIDEDPSLNQVLRWFRERR